MIINMLRGQTEIVTMHPRQDKVTVWQAQWEETLSNKDNQPIFVTQGDWIVEHPSGWLEKLTQQELEDRYEPA